MGIVEELQDYASAAEYPADEAVMLRAADLIERLKRYAEHHEDCDTNQPFKGVEFPPCTCGLTALIKEIGNG